MGWCPAWYPTLRAAKYLGVHPDDILQRSVYWRDKALTAEGAEAEAFAPRSKGQGSGRAAIGA